MAIERGCIVKFEEITHVNLCGVLRVIWQTSKICFLLMCRTRAYNSMALKITGYENLSRGTQKSGTIHLAGWSRQIARRFTSTGLVTSPDPEARASTPPSSRFGRGNGTSGVSRTLIYSLDIHSFSPLLTHCVQFTLNHTCSSYALRVTKYTIMRI